MIRLKNTVIIFIIVGLLLIAAACGKKADDADQAFTEEPEIKHTVSAFGVVKASEKKNITIDFPAVLEQLMVKNGQRVVMGEELVVLNVDEYMRQTRNKELELSMAKLELERLSRESGKTANDLELARKAHAAALEELQKKDTLYQEGAVTLADLQSYQRTVDEKEKAVKNLELALGSGDDAPEIRMQKSRIALLENDLSWMKSRFNKSYLRDNVIISDLENAVVYDIGYAPGDPLSEGKKVLSLLDFDSLIIEADVSEEFIGEVNLGAPVAITALADYNRVYNGEVTSIAGITIDKRGETIVPVEIKILDNDGSLLPGFNVDVEIERQF
ncbi:MAG: HlyD family efflux transporter periplasmic adaptor subunit [Bacillota bacterium]